MGLTLEVVAEPLSFMICPCPLSSEARVAPVRNMPDESTEKTADAGDDDLLGGLESILEEEGLGYDLPDEELTEDDISDLFSGDEEDSSDVVTAPSGPARAESVREIWRQKRGERRRRDLQDYCNLEAHSTSTASNLKWPTSTMSSSRQETTSLSPRMA